MKNILRLLKQKSLLTVTVAIGVAVGGITTAVVMAAEPDTNGQINACYLALTNTMSANPSGGTCPLGQTALSWDSGQPMVRDANGQILGRLLSYDDETGKIQIYNAALNRQLDLFNATNAGTVGMAGSDQFPIYFADSECAGQTYVSDPTGLAAHTKLFKIGTSTYGIVPDATGPTSVTVNSFISYDPINDALGCNDIEGGNTDNYYQLNTATLPFSLPVAVPLQL